MGSTREGALLRAIAATRTRARAELATLAEEAALGVEGMALALDTTLDVVTRESLARLRESALAHATELPGRCLGIVLAGNVPTAIVRPTIVALALGVSVRVRASSRGAGLAPIFADALAETALASSFELRAFERDDEREWERFVAGLDVLSVHGTRATLAQVAAKTPSTIVRREHGPGLGLAFVSREALARRGAAAIAERLALDIALYEQRGCFSPHAIYVEGALAEAPTTLAVALDRALATLAITLPRGPSIDGAAESLYRRAHQAMGEVWSGPHGVVTLAPGAVLPSPGRRHVRVVPVDERAAFVEAAAAWGDELKVVATDEDERATLADLLATAGADRGVAPLLRVSPFGQMQRPPLDAPTDGTPPWHRLVVDSTKIG